MKTIFLVFLGIVLGTSPAFASLSVTCTNDTKFIVQLSTDEEGKPLPKKISLQDSERSPFGKPYVEKWDLKKGAVVIWVLNKSNHREYTFVFPSECDEGIKDGSLRAVTKNFKGEIKSPVEQYSCTCEED